MPENRLDACLSLVSDRYRRLVIRRLRDGADGTATVEDLVDELHASEPISVTGPRTDRDQIAVQLCHVHLPKLAEHGVIDYEPERATVQYRPDEQVETVLDSLPGNVARLGP